MKKLITLVVIVVFIGIVLMMVSPPGDEIYDNYISYAIDSKLQFRSKKQFETENKIRANGGSMSGSSSGNSSGSTSVATGAYNEVPVPDDLSKESLQDWLTKISICPERRRMLEFQINAMGMIPYTYGGQGRDLYREDPSTWGNGTDCSGMVTASLYRAGIDYGFCFSTGSLASTFIGNQVSELMPGDISVVSGSHTELFLGKQADGTWVHIGVRSKNDPPGPSAIKNHATLLSANAIHVRPPQLQEADDRYYAEQGGSNE